MRWLAAIALVAIVLCGAPRDGHASDTADAILTLTTVGLTTAFLCGATRHRRRRRARRW